VRGLTHFRRCDVKTRHAIACERVVVQKLAQNSVKLGLRSKNALYGESPLYEVFHENTKLGRWNGRVYSAWAAAFAQFRPGQTPLHGGKIYSLMDRHALPQVEAHTALERTIEARRSIRTFSGAPLGVDQLARLLFFTYGRTDRRGSFRAVPSGGALYPLELYLAALNVDGLEAGIYHYAGETHHLDVVEAGNCHAALRDVLYSKGIDIDRASAVVVVTAAFQRSTIKYFDRGYRTVLMEAGEAAQNLSLLATSMDLGACLVDGFNDDRLSELLDIDGVDEAPLLAAVLGRPTASV
jgi:SagB-type dehydrogenase family enzyme